MKKKEQKAEMDRPTGFFLFKKLSGTLSEDVYLHLIAQKWLSYLPFAAQIL